MWKQGWPTCCLTRCTAPDVHKIVSRHQHSAQCTVSHLVAVHCTQVWTEEQKSNGKNERPVKWSFVSVAGQGGKEQVYWTRGARKTYLASLLPVHCTRSLLWSVFFGNTKKSSSRKVVSTAQGAWGQEESLTSEAKYPVVRQNAPKDFFECKMICFNLEIQPCLYPTTPIDSI